jgi:N-acetylated-alpha-linked acidic dipeptidase
MRLANADVVPYDFTDFADTIHQYLGELQKLLKGKQEEVTERNTQIEEGMFAATSDPRQPTVAPAHEDVPPHLNFAPLQNAADALTHSAERYQKALDKARKDGDLTLSQSTLQALNADLLQSERKLTASEGLPGRPWFKHLIDAPGQYTGYGAKTIPGVREAIEQKKWKEADEQIVRVSAALQDEAALIDAATGVLEASQK